MCVFAGGLLSVPSLKCSTQDWLLFTQDFKFTKFYRIRLNHASVSCYTIAKFGFARKDCA